MMRAKVMRDDVTFHGRIHTETLIPQVILAADDFWSTHGRPGLLGGV